VTKQRKREAARHPRSRRKGPLKIRRVESAEDRKGPRLESGHESSLPRETEKASAVDPTGKQLEKLKQDNKAMQVEPSQSPEPTPDSKVANESGASRGSKPGPRKGENYAWACVAEPAPTLRRHHISKCFMCDRLNRGSLVTFLHHLEEHRAEILRNLTPKDWLRVSKDMLARQLRTRGLIEELYNVYEGREVDSMESSSSKGNEGNDEGNTGKKDDVYLEIVDDDDSHDEDEKLNHVVDSKSKDDRGNENGGGIIVFEDDDDGTIIVRG